MLFSVSSSCLVIFLQATNSQSALTISYNLSKIFTIRQSKDSITSLCIPLVFSQLFLTIYLTFFSTRQSEGFLKSPHFHVIFLQPPIWPQLPLTLWHSHNLQSPVFSCNYTARQQTPVIPHSGMHTAYHQRLNCGRSWNFVISCFFFFSDTALGEHWSDFIKIPHSGMHMVHQLLNRRRNCNFLICLFSSSQIGLKLRTFWFNNHWLWYNIQLILY